MEFEVIRENLSKALSITNKAISAKASLPILQNLLIEEDSGRLKIVGTDLDRSIVTWVGAKISNPTSITIPAKPLVSFVSGLSDEKITGSVNKNSLSLKSKNASAKFNGVSAKDFPNINYELSDKFFEISTDVLKKAIDETYFAASIDEGKPAWTGVMFTVNDDELKVVALDGFRLSIKNLSVKDSTSNFKNSFSKVIIPAKNLVEVVRLAGGLESIKIDVQEDKSVVLFMLEDVLFVSKILEGDFPDYTKAIPETIVLNLELNSNELMSALKLASVFASERNAVRFSAKPSENTLTLLSDNVELGSNKLEVSLISAEGDDLDIAFDAKYILDYLNNVPSETLSLRCSGQSSPAIFKPKGRDDYIHVAVPLNPYW